MEFEENPHGHDFSFTGTFLGKTSFSPWEGFLTEKKIPPHPTQAEKNKVKSREKNHSVDATNLAKVTYRP